jgi:hypothetical protein
MTKTPNPFDRFTQLLAASAAIVTAATGAAATGHAIGWW